VSEERRVALVRGAFASDLPGVTVGIGDDCAVLERVGEPLVWTVDAQVEHVHFERAWMGLSDIGYRSFMAAASDLAAMGARPVGALWALALPATFSDEDLAALAAGVAEAAREVGVAVVGGNFTRASELGLTTTLLGAAASPVTRQGAAVGDGIWVAGALGLARVGLEACRLGVAGDPALAAAVAAFRRPRARLEAGRVAPRPRAMVDVSDGLALDLSRVAPHALLDEGALLARGGEGLAAMAAAVGLDPIACILHGGEDYALVAASPAALPGFARVGEVTASGGLRVRGPRGEVAVAPRGFDHFGG